MPFKIAPGDASEALSPDELAALLATRWVEARALASTPRISRWLHEDGSHEREAANIAAIEGAAGLSLDRRLVAILVELAPSQPRTYMGYALQTIGDVHVLASSALSVTDSLSLADAVTPRDVIQSPL